MKHLSKKEKFGFFKRNVAQLNLAREQLANQNRGLYPAALILIDNVVELLLYQHYINKLENLVDVEEVSNPDETLVREAREQGFNGKIQLAKKTNLISSESADSIRYLHRGVRNHVHHSRTAYGHVHEGIIRSATVFYYHIARELLRDFAALILNAQLDVVEIDLQEDLANELAVDMSKMINRIDEMIESLASMIARHDPSLQNPRKGCVTAAHAWALSDPTNRDGKKFAREKGVKYANRIEFASFLEDHYAKISTNDPIPAWKKRLCSLAQEANSHIALKKYFDWVNSTQVVREGIFYLYLEKLRRTPRT